jgi:pyridoxine 4-dehydrogenase
VAVFDNGTFPYNIGMNISPTITLGSDMTINRLGFGAMRITGDGIWGDPSDVGTAEAVLRRAIALGVNFIDTADAYGPETSENIIKSALSPYPSGLIIATKGGLVRPGPGDWRPNASPDHLRGAIQGSLSRLGLTHIDLYQLHTIDPATSLHDSVTTLKELQSEGLIRHIGLSNVSVEQLAEARSIVEIVSVQNHYNLMHRDSEDVLTACERDGLGFLPYFPIGGGMGREANLASPTGPLADIASKYECTPAQVALAWLLHHSPVIVPIPGTGSINHLEENMASLEISFNETDLKTLDALGA